jgi:hypothetical protein
MPKTNSLSSLADQPANSVKADEYLTVLTDSVADGLVELSTTENIKGQYAVGLLGPDPLAHQVGAALAAGPAADKALDAIASLFQPGDVVEVTAICPAGGGRVSLSGILDDPAPRAKLRAFVCAHIATRNLYFGVNPRSAACAGSTDAAKAVDVVARRTVFLDFDNKDAPNGDPDWSHAIALIRTGSDPAPALFVASGNGTHIYLPLADADTPKGAADATSSLKAMMAAVGADDMSDLPRIGRLPFTLNLPDTVKRGRGNVVKLALPLPDDTPRQGGDATPMNVSALCASIMDLKAPCDLPGRMASATSAPTAANANNATSAANSNGERKTGWAAPSADALRMALEEMPNDDGTFDRNEWVAVAYATKGAAVALGIAADAGEWFMAFCDKYPRNDPGESQKLWDEKDLPAKGWGGLMAILERLNPAGAFRVKNFMAQTAFANTSSTNIAAMHAETFGPLQLFDPTKIPPRAWLYSGCVIRGYIALLVAPGGTGKSALTVAEAVAMVTGKVLLPGDKPHKPLRVWMHNAEDSKDEMQRRVAATMMHHGITPADISDRLFVTSGRDSDMMLARQGRDGPEVIPGRVDSIVARLKANKIDVMMWDPLGAMHTLPENSNEAVNLLMGALREIAQRADVAIILVHHTSKAAAGDMVAAGAGASRGATALVDAARVTRELAPMTAKEAKSFLINEDERRRYVRIANGKANLAPAAGADWFRLVGVPLGNGSKEYPNGDNVQTVERWTPPTVAVRGALSDAEKNDVQDAIRQGTSTERRLSPRSPEWVGYLIGEVLGLTIPAYGTSATDRNDAEHFGFKQASDIITNGLERGWLVTADDRGGNGKSYPCVAVPHVDSASAEEADADA